MRVCVHVRVSFCAYVYSEHLPAKGKVRAGSKVCSRGEERGGHDMEKREKEKQKTKAEHKRCDEVWSRGPSHFRFNTFGTNRVARCSQQI